jgi:hypothetical protein
LALWPDRVLLKAFSDMELAAAHDLDLKAARAV